MRRRYFFLPLVAFFIFLYIGPVNFDAPYVPSTIPTEKNVLSDDPVIGEKIFVERGSKVYHGGGSWSYSTVLGEYNTFNGSHYVPYIYTANNHSVRYAGHVLTLYDWYTVLSNETDVLVEDMRWNVEYWQEQGGGRWAELDLWDHSFLSPIFSGTLMKLGQRFSDGSASLDVWYIVRNCDQMKVLLNFSSDTTREYRFVWQLTGVEGSPTYLNQSLQFEDVNLGWGDTEINATYEYSAVGRKCDIFFDPLIIEAGFNYVLDPAVNPVLGADIDDDYWDDASHMTASTTCHVLWYAIGRRSSQWRFSLAIPQGSTVTSANFTVYEWGSLGSALEADVRRIDEDNVGSLEGDATLPSTTDTNKELWVFDGTSSEWETVNITDMTNDAVNLVGWSSGNYFGFRFNATIFNDDDYCLFEDYSHAGTNHAYMNVTYTEGAANNAPANDQTPTLDNADDTDNMYAQYREYQMTVYVSDADGFSDIDYLEVGLWDNGRSTEYFRFRYDEDTDTFTEEYDSGTVVSLNTGSSTATESGNDIDATFYFTVDWDHADLTDIDLNCTVIDDEPESDTDFYEANFDVETRLDYSVAPSVTGDDAGTVDRGDYDESFTVGGTLIYYGSVDDNPASNQIDVWVSASEYGTNVGPWSDTTLTAGAFVVTCYADDALGQDTYTIKPVLEGVGSGGASQYYTTDLTDTYIADIVQVQSYSVSDSRVNINDNVNVDVTLYYDYDDSQVTDGTVTINGASASHQGSGVWRITVSESTVTSNTYNTVAVTGNTHGITTEDQNGQSTTVIWDRLVVTLSADSYSVVNGTQVNITISIVYDYDDSAFTYYNLSMTRDAVFWYVFNHANSSLCNDTAADIEYTYTVNALNNETQYGITAFTSNSIDIEWSASPPTTTPTVTITVTTGILFQLFLSLEMWGYIGPALLAIGGYFIARENKVLGVFYFVVECLVAYHYFTLVSATPDYWWHIYIIILGGMPVCISQLLHK